MEDENKPLKKSENNKETEKSEDHELMDDLPQEAKKVVDIAMSMQRFSGKIPNPLYDKINEEHISALLEIAKEEDQKNYKFASYGRIFNLIFVVIFVLLFVFLVVFLSAQNSDLLIDIIKMGVAAFGGFGAGYGLKSKKSNNP